MIIWGINNTGPTCRHVLGDDDRPICGQSRGTFENLDAHAAEQVGDVSKARELLEELPICARCQPVARARGLAL